MVSVLLVVWTVEGLPCFEFRRRHIDGEAKQGVAQCLLEYYYNKYHIVNSNYSCVV
jgi:hypothetical protein